MTKARDLANASTALSAVSATELGYLDGVTSAVQTQLDAKQAINANVSTTELGYLDGVTSAIQTQLDAKLSTATATSTYIPKTLTTTTGDIIYASGANTPARLGIGSTSQVLSVSGGVPAWSTPAGVTYAGAAVYKAASQSITANTWTTLLFDTENYDTNSFHSTSTNTGRLTIPSGAGGYYYLSIMVESYPGASAIIRLLLNGSTIGRGLAQGYLAELKQDGYTSIMFGSVTLNLAAGDYLEVQFLNPANTSTISQTYQINYLGA